MKMISKTAPLAGLIMVGWAMVTPAAAAPAGLPLSPLASFADELGATSEAHFRRRRCWVQCYGPYWRRTCVKRCTPHHRHGRHW